MDGTDWAYDVLVDLALAHSREHVRSRAAQFKREVLNACVGMACSDIDWGKKRTRYAYETVRDVCMELTRDVEVPSRDTGRYQSGYRTFRNGTCREDFGSDR